MNTTFLKPREWGLLMAALLLLALSFTQLDAVAHYAYSHAFADQRSALGLAHAMDVLSNLPFAELGLFGLARLWRGAQGGDVWPLAWKYSATVFFVGLVLTALASAHYHLQPDDAGLVWDRAAMAVAFAGMLGLACCERVSERAALWVAATVLPAGLVAVMLWRLEGNLMPWALVQFGGMALMVVLALLPAQGRHRSLRLGLVVLIYAAAKLLELADQPIFEATQGLVSGHSLKHVVASLAALPVLGALYTRPGIGTVMRQNLFRKQLQA